jgi:hypothetical protein
VEHVLGEREDLFWFYEETDRSGCFTVNGLLPKNYTLCALDPRSLVRTEMHHVAAGSDGVRLLLDSSDTQAVTGQVVDAEGRPVAGARVTPAVRTQYLLSNWLHRDYSAGYVGAATYTDRQGHFRFELGRSLLQLQVTRPNALPALLPLARDALRTELQVRLDDCAYLRFKGTHPALEADRFETYDAEGRKLLMVTRQGGESIHQSQGLVADNPSQITEISPATREVVFLCEDRELLRQPIQVAPLQTYTVELPALLPE